MNIRPRQLSLSGPMGAVSRISVRLQSNLFDWLDTSHQINFLEREKEKEKKKSPPENSPLSASIPMCPSRLMLRKQGFSTLLQTQTFPSRNEFTSFINSFIVHSFSQGRTSRPWAYPGLK